MMPNLRVIIVPDGRFFFAQGLELDYAVQGDNAEDAKGHFEQGLRATITQNLRILGHINGVLKRMPSEVLGDLMFESSGQFVLSSVISARLVHEALPFENILYLVSGPLEYSK